MKNILWYQDSENLSKDVISFNGEIITPPSDPRYREKYDMLYKIGNQAQGNKSICKLSEGYFIKGHFNEKDNIGRNIPFMFYSDSANNQEFANRLKKEAALNDKSCSDLLINDILNFKKGRISLTTTIVISVIIVAISLLIVFITNK